MEMINQHATATPWPWDTLSSFQTKPTTSTGDGGHLVSYGNDTEYKKNLHLTSRGGIFPETNIGFKIPPIWAPLLLQDENSLATAISGPSVSSCDGSDPNGVHGFPFCWHGIFNKEISNLQGPPLRILVEDSYHVIIPSSHLFTFFDAVLPPTRGPGSK